MSENKIPVKPTKTKLQAKDLKPARAEFTLVAFPNKKFHLKPFSLEDEIWLEETFGNDLETALGERKAMAKVAWHQLEERELFAKREVTFVNDEGDKNTVNLGGLKLFSSCISGAEEQVNVARAIAKTFGISQPMMDKLMEAEKKRVEKAQSPLSP